MSDGCFREYLDSIVVGVRKALVPRQLDVVLDARGPKAVGAYGALDYFDALARAKLTSIERISATSTGAVVALAFLLRDRRKKEVANLLSCLRGRVNKRTGDVSDEAARLGVELAGTLNADDLDHLTGRLYITYKLVSRGISYTVHAHTTVGNLIESIERACHAPGPTAKYCDGISPAFFVDNKRPAVMINAPHCIDWSSWLSHGRALNATSMELEGALDAHDFFTTGNSRCCEYVTRGWSATRISMAIREIICILAALFLRVLEPGCALFPVARPAGSVVQGIVSMLLCRQPVSAASP